MTSPRVQFIHGLEGSPQGSKARLFAERFTAVTPAMDTGDFEACVALQAETITKFRPDVLVGSSFGGAVAVALLQRGLWRGPTLLLAQAALRHGLPAQLPEGVTMWSKERKVSTKCAASLRARGVAPAVRKGWPQQVCSSG